MFAPMKFSPGTPLPALEEVRRERGEER